MTLPRHVASRRYNRPACPAGPAQSNQASGPAGAALSGHPGPVRPGSPRPRTSVPAGLRLRPPRPLLGPGRWPGCCIVYTGLASLRPAPLRSRSAPLRRPVPPASGPCRHCRHRPLGPVRPGSPRPRTCVPYSLKPGLLKPLLGRQRRPVPPAWGRCPGASYRPEQTFCHRPRRALAAHHCNGSDAGTEPPGGRLSPLGQRQSQVGLGRPLIWAPPAKSPAAQSLTPYDTQKRWSGPRRIPIPHMGTWSGLSVGSRC